MRHGEFIIETIQLIPWNDMRQFFRWMPRWAEKLAEALDSKAHDNREKEITLPSQDDDPERTVPKCEE